MEHSEKRPNGAGNLPAAVHDALQLPIPGPCASKKRALELAFPQPLVRRDAKRAYPQSYLSTPTRNENLNHVQNGDDVSADVGSSATRHHLLLDPALINQTLASNAGNDVVASSHSCQMDPSETEVSLDRSHIQEASAAESNTSESNEIYASCNKEQVLRAPESPLEHTRNEIRKCLENIKQNTPGGVIDQDITSIIVNEVVKAKSLALPEEANRIRLNFSPPENEPMHTAKIESDQIPSQHINSSSSRFLSPHDYIDDSTLPLSPSIFSPRMATAAPCTTRSLKHDMSTQTEPMATYTSDTGPDSHTSCQLGFSDTELWQRELKSIRRRKPLATGDYTKVNVPLREIFKKAASYDAKNNNTNATSKSVPRRPQGLGAETNRNIRRDSCDVVSVIDTDDDHNEIRTYNSCRIGGGDHGVSRSSSGEEEVPVRGQQSLHGGFSNGRSYSPVEFSSDGGSDVDESIGKEAAVYSNRRIASMGRYDGNDSIDGHDKNAYYVDTHSGPNTLNHNDVIIATRREHSGLTYKSAVAPDRRECVQRGRSRSPVYQRRRWPEEVSYHTDRHYSPRYSSDEYAVQVRYDNARRHHDPPNTWKQRYTRDEPEYLTFYGYTATKKASREVEHALRYQDRLSDVGEIPGPRSALRFKLDNYLRDIRSDAVGLAKNIKSVIQETFYAYETIDEEQGLEKSWANQPMNMYKGFPLVEDIGFVSVRNRFSPDGDCYWRALAYILHGKPTRWDMIKADHLAYIQHVLGDKTHPRHQLYAQLNSQFFETHGGLVSSNGCAAMTSAFKANVWQLLHLPQSWTPGVMQQITADLYNIYLVTFTYDALENMCSEVSIRGAYNSRHVFMLYTNNNHFQPLTVNEYLS
ncbi:hypothetical protein RRF57_009819 [Xylaria bambusicola]|uniref:OTU domain-containing protein n=1 Tax=Xylaria bambusicola TaxID=326684 RepID=A0AAN7UK89_9PEZI